MDVNSSNMPATVGRLLASAEIDLELRHGDPETAFAAVRHADRTADRHWLAASDLRLTESSFTLPRPTSDTLFDPLPAALVYLLEPRRRAVPEALLKRCVDAGVALLVASPSTNPERVEEEALKLLVSEAGAGLARLASVQRYLLAALDGPKPEREVLDRVNRLSGLSLALLTPWGETVARAGDRVSRLSHRDVDGLPEGRMRLRSETALVAKVHARGRQPVDTRQQRDIARIEDRAFVPEQADLRLVGGGERIARGLGEVPGVTSVGLSSSITMDGEDNANPLYVEGVAGDPGELPPLRRFKSLGPGYFETMGNRIVAGRPIEWQDIHQAQPVVIISRNLAQEYWGGAEEAIGRRVRNDPDGPWQEIVGVVGDERDDGGGPSYDTSTCVGVEQND